MRLTPLLLCAALFAGPALAADPKADEAKKHFTRSKELYDDGDFPGALNELERAYAAVPNFKLLFNIGQIQAQTQNYAGALRSFRKVLVDGGSEVTEARRAEVLKEIDKFRTRVAELTILCAEGAEISVDDVVIGKAPLADPVTVNVGKRKVGATLQNHFPLTKLVDVAGMDMLNVKLELQPVVAASATTTTAPTTSPTKVEPATPSKPMAAWVPWVGTVLLGAGTAVAGVLALGASKDQTTLLAKYGTTRAQLDAAVGRTHTLALVTDILAGVTAAAAIGSLLYTIFRPADPAPTVSLGVTSNSVVLTGSF
jgi:hypothetical protein